MSHMLTTTRQRPTLLIAVAGLALVALYLLAIDQGHLLAFVQGQVAFDQNLLHEFVHDARHAAGFPCH